MGPACAIFSSSQAVRRDQLLIWHLSQCISFTVKGESIQFVSFHGQPTKEVTANFFICARQQLSSNDLYYFARTILSQRNNYFETQKLVDLYLCIYLWKEGREWKQKSLFRYCLCQEIPLFSLVVLIEQWFPSGMVYSLEDIYRNLWGGCGFCFRFWYKTPNSVCWTLQQVAMSHTLKNRTPCNSGMYHRIFLWVDILIQAKNLSAFYL